MPPFQRNHIVIQGRTEALPYTSNSTGRSIEIRTGLNRTEHGAAIQEQFNAVISDFRADNDNFIYVVFKSHIDFFLDLNKLDNKDYRLSSYKPIQIVDNETSNYYYEATVCLNKKAVSSFLRKVEDYLSRDTKIKYNEDGTIKSGGNPLNQSLIANIDEIRIATLENFWQEPELPFPITEETIWWEVWLNRHNNENALDLLQPFLGILNQAQIQIGDRNLEFPEHCVFLMRCTSNQLSALLYTDKLAEIRKPKDTAAFFVDLERQEQNEWIESLRARVDHHADASIISVCLLDTGVNRVNPLLLDLIPERNLDSIQARWTNADIAGHGTPMAGLSLYGDLTDILATDHRIQIYHHLESIKLIAAHDPNNPELYGAVTQEAIARGVLINPLHKRIVCMAITSDDIVHSGRPSSWSSAIDQSIFGSINRPNDTTLFFVSSGNLSEENRLNYPVINSDCSIEDPAQAFNVITVGAYTLKDQLDLEQYPRAELLAPRGGMSPCNTTSQRWHKEWCKKPEIVMEGGNQALWNEGVLYADSLQLLSASKGGRSWLTTFSDTSASTALASKFAAELYFHYPTLWPETIRGLIVHSADWTPSMLNNRQIGNLSAGEKLTLLSQVGYGVPNMEKAKFSANNSLSLIAERVLKPYKKEDYRIKTDQFHLFNLPWPVEVLQGLFNTNVKVKITLSYFIEPNPGNKEYKLSASYRSHGLRFKMIDSGERLSAFKARISKEMKEEDYEPEGGERNWVLGNLLRDKGSIHKDIWEGPAVDLASRDKVAIYPVGGWWKNRKNLNRFDATVRYSLIITIETPSTETDIFTPVFEQIQVDIPVEI